MVLNGNSDSTESIDTNIKWIFVIFKDLFDTKIKDSTNYHQPSLKYQKLSFLSKRFPFGIIYLQLDEEDLIIYLEECL